MATRAAATVAVAPVAAMARGKVVVLGVAPMAESTEAALTAVANAVGCWEVASVGAVEKEVTAEALGV